MLSLNKCTGASGRKEVGGGENCPSLPPPPDFLSIFLVQIVRTIPTLGFSKVYNKRKITNMKE